MTDATIATDIHQALDVHLNLRTEITFNFVLSTDNLTDSSSLIICPLAHLQVAVDTCFIQYLC